MISVLIPTYNRKCYNLAAELSRQLVASSIVGEVIVLDDGSTDAGVKAENSKVAQLSYCRYVEQEKNQGSERARINLASLAKYDLLLFVDADTFPKDKNFIYKYLRAAEGYQAVSGGLDYRKTNGETEISPLRYLYGKRIEAHSARWRNSRVGKVVIGGNCMVTRYVFDKISAESISNSYGYEELLISKAICDAGATLIHIDNPVFHDDNLTSEQYLSKTRCAVENLSRHAVEYYPFSRLLHFHIGIERFKLCWLLTKLYKYTSRLMEINLKSKHPSVALFQFYKLCYFCCVEHL